MSIVKAKHYDETERRLQKDHIVIHLASEMLWNELNERFLHDNGEPTFDFMQRANEAYRSRGGQDGGHIGAIANAIVFLVNQE